MDQRRRRWAWTISASRSGPLKNGTNRLIASPAVSVRRMSIASLVEKRWRRSRRLATRGSTGGWVISDPDGASRSGQTGLPALAAALNHEVIGKLGRANVRTPDTNAHIVR